MFAIERATAAKRGKKPTCWKHHYPERKHYSGPAPYTCLSGKSLQCCLGMYGQKGWHVRNWANIRFAQIQALFWAFPTVLGCIAVRCFVLGTGGGDQRKEALEVPALAVACPTILSLGRELGLKWPSGRQMGSTSVAACCSGQSLLLPKLWSLLPSWDCWAPNGKRAYTYYGW